MKLTIKNLEKRYNVKIHSVMNFEKGIRMWMIKYHDKELYFENKNRLYDFFKEINKGSLKLWRTVN